jgi:hypothetical protein
VREAHAVVAQQVMERIARREADEVRRSGSPKIFLKNIYQKACRYKKSLYLCINTFVFICLGF